VVGGGPPPRVALFGYPLGHSLSPAMHHAAAVAIGLPLEYRLWQLGPAALEDAVQTIRGSGWLGANITLPYKREALVLADDASPLARRIGAANTLYKRDRSLLAENTDAPALLRCLTAQLDFRPADERVVLLGAGGAARAAAFALAGAGVASLGIANRSGDRASALARDVAASLPPGLVTPSSLDVASLGPALRRATLLINATSVGLDGVSSPIADLPLPAGARIYDLVYGPGGTSLVRQARALGFSAVDGLEMLVYQAAAAFALWTLREADPMVMLAAAQEALRARARVGVAPAVHAAGEVAD